MNFKTKFKLGDIAYGYERQHDKIFKTKIESISIHISTTSAMSVIYNDEHYEYHLFSEIGAYDIRERHFYEMHEKAEQDLEKKRKELKK